MAESKMSLQLDRGGHHGLMEDSPNLTCHGRIKGVTAAEPETLSLDLIMAVSDRPSQLNRRSLTGQIEDSPSWPRHRQIEEIAWAESKTFRFVVAMGE